jgi:signal transduction histidine kinase
MATMKPTVTQTANQGATQGPQPVPVPMAQHLTNHDDSPESLLQEDRLVGLQAIADAHQMSALALDRQYRYLAFNRAHFERMKTLYGAHIQLNHCFYEYQTVPEDALRSRPNLDRALAGESLTVRSYSGIDPNRRYLEITHLPIRDRNDQVVGVSVFSTDISALQQAEEALKLSELRLQHDREEMELELRHSQKLEAVGRLAAGIAHEINTPIQYLNDSATFLRDAFEGVMRLIPLYREAVRLVGEIPEHAKLAQDVAEAEEDTDLEFARDNLGAAFERCFDGISRVSNIVKSMKEFAHPDLAEKNPADLNQAIQSSVTISRNEYKYVADLELDLGELPLVMCHIGHLNQVFLNLIVNAADAIAETVGNSGNRGKIKITTHSASDCVCIAIADSGAGIPPDIRERVFDPFFTTKPVNKGTGQGLAIARAIIVDKHFGILSFESELGEGTTFIIRLPVDGKTPVGR